jgi:hypothetical protein
MGVSAVQPIGIILYFEFQPLIRYLSGELPVRRVCILQEIAGSKV